MVITFKISSVGTIVMPPRPAIPQKHKPKLPPTAHLQKLKPRRPLKPIIQRQPLHQHPPRLLQPFINTVYIPIFGFWFADNCVAKMILTITPATSTRTITTRLRAVKSTIRTVKTIKITKYKKSIPCCTPTLTVTSRLGNVWHLSVVQFVHF